MLSAHRLPAPIQEVPESPTPVEEQAKPKKSRSKSRSVESEPKAKPSPSAASIAQGPARFAGTWAGTINQGILGDLQMTLVINATATSVKEISKGATFDHPIILSGNMRTWKGRCLNEITWTFTPAGDGKTAAVTSKSGLGVNGASIFRRQ
jgi:hypothetical protein